MFFNCVNGKCQFNVVLLLLNLFILNICSQWCKGDVESKAAKSFSFQYDQGKVVESGSMRTHMAAVPQVEGEVYVYSSFDALATNPGELVDGRVKGMQTVGIGYHKEQEFIPVVRFGIVQDTHTGLGGYSYLLPWVEDKHLDYYGMYVRPETPYDFKIKLSLDKHVMTVWVSGRGDDDWFMLAEEVPLLSSATIINTIHVEQNVGASGVEIVVDSQPWLEGESVRPHPLAKKNRAVKKGNGFRFQSQRSVWRKPGRHITVAHNNPKNTPHASAWLGFPDVVQTGPKNLVSTYCDGRAHGGGGRLLIRHSEDLGKTWKEPVAMQYPDKSYVMGVNCPRLQKLGDGSLLLLADIHGGGYDVVFFRSRDAGHSWEHTGRLVAAQAGGHKSIVPSRITELEDGSWLITSAWGVCPEGPFACTEGQQVEVFRSEDQGKSWALLSGIEEWPRGLCETSIVVLPSGRLWLFAREIHRLLPGVKTYSDDNGKTWAPLEEMPFPITGRTCADFLQDGRVLLTFRSLVGRAALWAWAGDPEEKTKVEIVGSHFNDTQSVALKEGALHLDSDGYRGQFTQYILRTPDSPESEIDVTAELQVKSNYGGAATLSIPYVGKLRFFPDRVESGHDATLKFPVEPGIFHIYRVVRKGEQMTLYIDGKEMLVTDKIASKAVGVDWTPIRTSPYLLAFGNEPVFDPVFELTEQQGKSSAEQWNKKYEENVSKLEDLAAIPPIMMIGMGVQPCQITPSVTGYSIWRRVEVRLEDPKTGVREQSWVAERDGFPDQYQLDRVLQVGASIVGGDQGYSGWTQLEDGRVLVLDYTDDTAPACPSTPNWPTGLSWIRGTYVFTDDLKPLETVK